MEDNKLKISDLGIIVTIGGILLYSLGWIYWKKYFEGLNIDVSFIDLSIDRVISTTWINIIFLFITLAISFAPIYIYNFINKYIKEIFFNLPFNISVILIIFVTPAILFTINYFSIQNTSPLYYFVFLVLTIIIARLIFALLIRIKFYISFKYLMIYTFMSFYICGVIHYTFKGINDAKKFIETYKENIIITSKSKETISGKFIGLMKNNYFVLIKNNGIYETYAIREDEVSQAKLINKVLIKTP